MCPSEHTDYRSGALAAMFAVSAEAPHLCLPTPLPTQTGRNDLYEKLLDVQKRLDPLCTKARMNPIDPVATWDGVTVEQVCVFGGGLPGKAVELVAIQGSRCGCMFTLRATPNPYGLG